MKYAVQSGIISQGRRSSQNRSSGLPSPSRADIFPCELPEQKLLSCSIPLLEALWKASPDTVKEGLTKLGMCMLHALVKLFQDTLRTASEDGTMSTKRWLARKASHLFVGAVQTQAASLLV